MFNKINLILNDKRSRRAFDRNPLHLRGRWSNDPPERPPNIRGVSCIFSKIGIIPQRWHLFLLLLVDDICNTQENKRRLNDGTK